MKENTTSISVTGTIKKSTINVQILSLESNWRVIYLHWTDHLSAEAEDDFKQRVLPWGWG